MRSKRLWKVRHSGATFMWVLAATAASAESKARRLLVRQGLPADGLRAFDFGEIDAV